MQHTHTYDMHKNLTIFIQHLLKTPNWSSASTQVSTAQTSHSQVSCFSAFICTIHNLQSYPKNHSHHDKCWHQIIQITLSLHICDALNWDRMMNTPPPNQKQSRGKDAFHEVLMLCWNNTKLVSSWVWTAHQLHQFTGQMRILSLKQNKAQSAHAESTNRGS